MSIRVKHYPNKRICDDYYGVIEFLKKHGATGYNISNQDFYYRIGFKEYSVCNLWEKHIPHS